MGKEPGNLEELVVHVQGGCKRVSLWCATSTGVRIQEIQSFCLFVARDVLIIMHVAAHIMAHRGDLTCVNITRLDQDSPGVLSYI